MKVLLIFIDNNSIHQHPLSFKKIQCYCNTLYRKGLSCGNTLSKKHRMKEAEVDI